MVIDGFFEKIGSFSIRGGFLSKVQTIDDVGAWKTLTLILQPILEVEKKTSRETVIETG